MEEAAQSARGSGASTGRILARAFFKVATEVQAKRSAINNLLPLSA